MQGLNENEDNHRGPEIKESAQFADMAGIAD
jgi:hypothetical protein